ncbi:MAG: metallophosphoesterase [Bryobacteraceae bacterium]
MPKHKPSSTRALTLLHLSDTQFGKHHRFGSGLPYDTLFQRLCDDFDGPLKQAAVPAPQVIVHSGDLAEWGVQDEFQEAFRFLGDLGKKLGIERSHI